jgi:hypothetical protein
MTIFELVFHFWSFRCASFDLEYKIQTFCIWSCQCTHQGGDCETKWFCALVYFCDELLTCFSLNLNSVDFGWTNPELSYSVWRGVFSYLVMCWWWMRHGGQWWGLRQEYETWCGGSGMINHKSGTRWLNDREVGWHRVRSTSYTWQRREAWVSRFSLKTSGDSLWVVWPQNHCDGSLVWASKPIGMRFIGCASKSMSGWRWCEDTRRHPVACFIVKQVGLGFPSFASKLVKERLRVVHVASSWRSCGGEAKDGRLDGIECGAAEVGPNYHSLDVIFLLAYMGILVFCFRYK